MIHFAAHLELKQYLYQLYFNFKKIINLLLLIK